MKAWQLMDADGPESYQLEEVADPEPGPGEVRIKIKFSALNHLDLWLTKGLPAPKHLPHTGGADAAGVVDAVGDGTAGFEPGDEIIIDPSFSCGHCSYCLNDNIVYCESFQILGEHRPGTFTEKLVIPTINAIRKPGAMSWEVAGSFGLVSATALRMLERARLRRGETVLVVGVGGGVSAAALHLALAMGAQVYVTSRSPEKIAWAVEEGAVEGFDSAGEFGAEMTAQGGSTSGPKMELTIPHLFFRQLELIGSSMGTHGQFARAAEWIGSARAKAPVGKVFDFEDLPEALAYLDSGEQTGKVALRHPD
jgi:NADPH:quinone reductase-like Zn-dependent oxidoreductase